MGPGDHGRAVQASSATGTLARQARLRDAKIYSTLRWLYSGHNQRFSSKYGIKVRWLLSMLRIRCMGCRRSSVSTLLLLARRHARTLTGWSAALAAASIVTSVTPARSLHPETRAPPAARSPGPPRGRGRCTHRRARRPSYRAMGRVKVRVRVRAGAGVRVRVSTG